MFQHPRISSPHFVHCFICFWWQLYPCKSHSLRQNISSSGHICVLHGQELQSCIVMGHVMEVNHTTSYQPVHNLPHYLFKIHSNVILPSTRRSPKWPLSVRILTEIFMLFHLQVQFLGWNGRLSHKFRDGKQKCDDRHFVCRNEWKLIISRTVVYAISSPDVMRHRVVHGCPIQWLPGTLSLGVKRSRREADHSPHLMPRSKNEWSYTSTPPIRLHGVLLS
jgi:hypothetical protein